MTSITLDPNDLKKYITVSNLSFMSNVLEKVVMKQFLEYLNANDLLPRSQLVYRSDRVPDDSLSANDDSKLSVLTLLDLSAAFDTNGS